MGVDAVSLERLDRYEADLYERLTIDVRTERGRADAFVYAIREEQTDILSSERWSEMDFRARHLREYLHDLER